MPKDMFKDFICNNMEKFNCIYDEERDNNLKYMKFIKNAIKDGDFDLNEEKMGIISRAINGNVVDKVWVLR
jgi:uncharacterized phage-like protein YoqJ